MIRNDRSKRTRSNSDEESENGSKRVKDTSWKNNYNSYEKAKGEPATGMLRFRPVQGTLIDPAALEYGEYDMFEAPRFIAAACSVGSRPGYVFARNGAELGYHLEDHSCSDPMRELAGLPFWTSSKRFCLPIPPSAPTTYDGPTGGLVGSTVRVTRMLRPDLNGREGFAEAFSGTINRYTVRFNQGESLQLLASQLIHVNDSTPDLARAGHARGHELVIVDQRELRLCQP